MSAPITVGPESPAIHRYDVSTLTSGTHEGVSTMRIANAFVLAIAIALSLPAIAAADTIYVLSLIHI